MRMKYLGPKASLSMKLKRAVVDLHEEKRSLAPGGEHYARLEALIAEIDATHLVLFRKPAREPVGFHVCGVEQVQKSEKPGPSEERPG